MRIELAFPASSTSLGWTNEATDSYRTLSPFGDTGSLLLYAAIIGYVIYRVIGLIEPGGLRRAARRTVSSAVSSSVGIVAMVGMALAMTDSGMTYALAQSFGERSTFDMGLCAQNLVLAAHALGLGTVLQASVTDYAAAIREYLGLPETLRLIIGVSVGYEDESAVLNRYRALKQTPDEFTMRYE